MPENGSSPTPTRARRTWLDQVGLIAARGRELLNLGGGANRRTQSPEELCRRLLEQRGEASALALASVLVQQLSEMDEASTAAFLDVLAERFSPDPVRVQEAVDAWERSRDSGALQHLADTAEAPRQELFRRLNMAPGGTAELVRLRNRMLNWLPERPELRPVDADLRHLLSSWFNRGFLQLEEITWNSPAAVLERLIEYEAVHAIQGWDDLRRRLAQDRRCFAFFHPALPGEPLVFVEVALTQGLPGAIQPLIDPDRASEDPAQANSAIFFSISSTQRGLRGISFGSFLIKQVMGELSAELPRLQTFATLSPVPGLASALRRAEDPEGFTEDRLRALATDASGRGRSAEPPTSAATLDHLDGDHRPHTDAERRLLERLTLAYLTQVRRGQTVEDSVAHFHLSNGARLERIHVDADTSENGRPSRGVMVNYLYDPERLEFNHERYVDTGTVALSRGLAAELKRVQAAWRA
ncbi:MAG: malonyl-CoA decarboxylase [bacterium]|jgi:malonyl-CoA decarboxylase|nr:malonyl-CoA decarboxylase [bacterium]